MTDPIQKAGKSALIINMSSAVFPLSLIGPFAVLSGILTLPELVGLFLNPKIWIHLTTDILLAWAFARIPFRNSRGWNESDLWEELLPAGRRIISQSILFMPVVAISSAVTLQYFAGLNYPRMGLVAFLLVLAFLLMVNLSFMPILFSRVDSFIRERTSAARLGTSLKVRIAIPVMGNFTGSVLMFITLKQVDTINNMTGRIPPLGMGWTFIIGGVLACLSLIMSLTILMKNMIVPLQKMTDSFSLGARGDFTEDVHIESCDEVGQMAAMTNILFSSLNRALSQVVTSVRLLQENKDQLGVRVEEIAGSLNGIRHNLSSTSGQMEENSSNVIETSAAVEELTRNIESLGEHINTLTGIISRSSRSISELTEANQKLNELAGQNRDKMEGLNRVSHVSEEKLKTMTNRIQSVMENSRHLMEANQLIANVAAQTNLLAMNAAIEAAHAGDAGRGFTVVADEIRKLAETSSAQSKSISANLKVVMNDIELVGTDSQAVQTSFLEINNHVNDVSEAIAYMNDFTENVRSFGNQLEEALGKMKSVSDSVAMGSAEMRRGNEEILKAIINMKEINMKVLEAVHDITVGADEINHQSSEMLEQNHQTDESLAGLMSELGNFKIREY